MMKLRRKAGDARRRQVNRLRKQAEVRTIVVGAKEYTAPVIECPPPMNCKPLGSPGRSHYARSLTARTQSRGRG